MRAAEKGFFGKNWLHQDDVRDEKGSLCGAADAQAAGAGCWCYVMYT